MNGALFVMKTIIELRLWEVGVWTSTMHRDVGISIVLTSTWRMDDMKATLQCCANVRQVHRGTAATNTTPGFFCQY